VWRFVFWGSFLVFFSRKLGLFGVWVGVWGFFL
jgi:hypothetical protein